MERNSFPSIHSSSVKRTNFVKMLSEQVYIGDCADATVASSLLQYLRLVQGAYVELKIATSVQKANYSTCSIIQRTFYKRNCKFKQKVLFAGRRFIISKELNVLMRLY